MTHESDSWWEIPWISYFVSLFKHPFNITEFSILEFEDSLNNDDQGPTNKGHIIKPPGIRGLPSTLDGT